MTSIPFWTSAIWNANAGFQLGRLDQPETSHNRWCKDHFPCGEEGWSGENQQRTQQNDEQDIKIVNRNRETDLDIKTIHVQTHFLLGQFRRKWYNAKRHPELNELKKLTSLL